jgi:hypothetical protein
MGLKEHLKGGRAAPPDDETRLTEPLGLRLPEATRISGFSRSDLYRRAARGEIIFRKCGKAVIVDYATLKAAYEDLPVADIRVAAA